MALMRHPANVTKSYIFKLSIPIFFSNLAIPLVGITDTILMGHLSSEKFLVAASISTAVISLIFWSFGFFRMGTVGMIAQSFGKSDYSEIVLTVMRNLLMALIIGFLIIFLYVPIVNLIDLFYEVTDETFSLIKKYIFIRVFSAPAELVIYVLTGFYLGLQKTKISSTLICFFCFLNIFISIYLVNYQNLDIKGVAFGTLISSYLTIIIFLIYTYFFIIKKFKVIPRLKRALFKSKIIKLLSINFDIFVRTVLLTFSFLWMNYLSSKLGEDFLAANSILLQFIIMTSFFLDAYAFSSEGIVGYAVGSKSKKSFMLTVRNSFELSFFTGLILSIIYLLFFRQIINVFTSLDLIRFLSYGYIFWLIVIPPIASFCYQFDGIFIGASQTKEMRNAMIMSVSLYVLISLYFLKLFGNHGLWISLIIFFILRSLTLNMYFFKITKKLS
tara:strand:+ start:248 stop:1576 length:1329 start_codon:yes stop_codon:yes gene_type:complete